MVEKWRLIHFQINFTDLSTKNCAIYAGASSALIADCEQVFGQSDYHCVNCWNFT